MTKNMFIVYGGNPELLVEGYTDSDFESNVDIQKFNSGYVSTLNGGAISWRCCKQSTTANSITEAEYMDALESAKEAIWIKEFITELGVVPSIESPVILYCDNNGAIAQAMEPRSHQDPSTFRGTMIKELELKPTNYVIVRVKDIFDKRYIILSIGKKCCFIH
ncbi:hypothetical protein L3X38_024888 [Prunus dulcis]|uniref:Transposable element protein n=1 Tax=Prunus dulcis TaxID=3755 RepID=A0AAD4W0M3_PRUDU|nr:hypothetical protein L3X38_024888 [Prunus dulcis]